MQRYKSETHKNLMKDFYWFFYYNQYDEKYQHFRCADVIKDEPEYNDEIGDWIEGEDIVVFYNDF